MVDMPGGGRAKRRHLPGAAAALLCALPLPAMAQEPAAPPASDDAIVVQGIREKARVIDAYVRALTVITSRDPLPRYAEDSYCPGVVGLSAARNAELAARMRQVAAAAGVKPAAESCRTSALVLFVNDKDSFLEAFRKAHPVYFNDRSRRHWSPPREAGPAMAWHLSQRLDAQGDAGGSGNGIKVFESPMGGSRITEMTRPVIAMSVVIIERRALVGLTPVQIADYALMRSLTDRAPTNLQGTAAETILTAIDAPTGSAIPASLTEWDLAYVRGRYATPEFRNGYSQGAAIRAGMKKKLAPKDAGDRERD